MTIEVFLYLPHCHLFNCQETIKRATQEPDTEMTIMSACLGPGQPRPFTGPDGTVPAARNKCLITEPSSV